jgi:hypothetical protein
MSTFRYDSPQYTVSQLNFMNLPAIAASTVALKWPAHCALKIKRLTAIVQVAGTATGAGYDVFNGTSSVGGLTLGTSAANSVVSLTQNIVLASGGFFEVRTKANSATLAAGLNVEFETPYPANLTD